MTDEKRIEQLPGCLGQFDAADDVCNGSEDDPDPCAFRNICGAFQQHLKNNEEDREEYLDVHEQDGGVAFTMAGATTNEEFVEWCMELVSKYGIQDGVPVSDDKEPESEPEAKATSESAEKAEPESEPAEEQAQEQPEVPPAEAPAAAPEPAKSAKPKKKPKKKLESGDRKKTIKTGGKPAKPGAEADRPKYLAEKVKDRRNQLMQMLQHFLEHLYGQFPESRKVKGDDTIQPGQFYLVDRRGTGYVSVYCRTPKGRDAAVCLLALKPRTMTFDVELPLESGTFKSGISDTTIKRFEEIEAIKDINDGRFKCLIRSLDVEKLALMAESIGKLAEINHIQLPDAPAA